MKKMGRKKYPQLTILISKAWYGYHLRRHRYKKTSEETSQEKQLYHRIYVKISQISGQ
jgi:hypothetical protein